MKLESKIEGLLFYKGEDLTIVKLTEILKTSEEAINESLILLEQSLAGRGLTLIRKDDAVMLGISSELAPFIESIRKEEINNELSKASLETLSIVLYKNDITRSDIDYIRGVNSSFILRNLLIRGLLEKVIDKKDSRRVLYRPTFDTLSFMGIKNISELPNYTKVQTELNETLTQKENHD